MCCNERANRKNQKKSHGRRLYSPTFFEPALHYGCSTVGRDTTFQANSGVYVGFFSRVILCIVDEQIPTHYGTNDWQPQKSGCLNILSKQRTAPNSENPKGSRHHFFEYVVTSGCLRYCPFNVREVCTNVIGFIFVFRQSTISFQISIPQLLIHFLHKVNKMG